ncbi:hypothetical protein ACIQNV_29675 [Streptomyces hydrogenans]|uniref:hypothetical protein n=1 Tax=Streptomyces hydrogenans TaxID=1873719 RepID=UPI0038093374
MTTMTNARATVRRPVPGAVLIAAGLLAPVVHAVGHQVAGATRLLVLLTVFGQAWPYWFAMTLLCGAGVRLVGARRSVWVPLVSVCAAAAVLLLLGRLAFGGLLSPDWRESRRVAAPGGAERYVTVETGRAVIDPLWRVTVVSGSGLTARGHVVATYGERSGFLAVAWDGPDTLLVTGTDGVVPIRLDSRTGKPDRTVDLG